MRQPLSLHEDRLFPAEPAARGIARRLYSEVAELPIVSPHGHTDPSWFADNENFDNPSDLLIVPDHYLYRMLHSQGVALTGIVALGIAFGADRVQLVLAQRARHRCGPVRTRFEHCVEHEFCRVCHRSAHSVAGADQ